VNGFLTPLQVAEREGLAVKTLSNWRALGIGPAFVKVGRLVRYEESAVVAWEKSLASGEHAQAVAS
jgi:predicted DNA-binding transcriptional regulator AlpA